MDRSIRDLGCACTQEVVALKGACLVTTEGSERGVNHLACKVPLRDRFDAFKSGRAVDLKDAVGLSSGALGE